MPDRTHCSKGRVNAPRGRRRLAIGSIMWAAFAAGTLVLLHPAAIEGQAGQEPPGAYTVAATAASTAPLDPNFDELGRNSYRDGGGYLPFEHIDPFTGNVLLTFVDAVLPGNAGLDLVLARTYNSKVYAEYATLTIPEDSWAGVGWRLHLGRVLEPTPFDDRAVVEMPDGTQRAVFFVSGPQDTTTKDFWRYDASQTPPLLKLPNGREYRFGHRGAPVAGKSTLYVTEISDPFNNKFVVTYWSDSVPTAPADAIRTVTQNLGNGQVRTVDFTYDSGARKSLTSMRVSAGGRSRTWQFRQRALDWHPTFSTSLLEEVEPPEGAPWKYQYNVSQSPYYELSKVTTPGGGWVAYRHDFRWVQYCSVNPLSALPPMLSRGIVRRETGGRGVTPGLWTYAYQQGPQANATEVTTPVSIVSHAFYGIGGVQGICPDRSNGLPILWGYKIGTEQETKTTQGGALLERRTRSYRISAKLSDDLDPQGGPYVAAGVHIPLLDSQVVERGNGQYTRTHEYRDTDLNDYGRPRRVIESGSLTRETTYEYRYGFTRYIVDRLATETVKVAGESFARSWDYDSKGFRTRETTYGIQVSFVPTSTGNTASSTNANSHTTSYAYSWGVQSEVQPPVAGSGVTRSINPEGTVATETRRGFSTTFQYDGLLRETRRAPPVGNPIVTEYDNTAGAWMRIVRGASVLTTNLDGFGRPVGTSNSEGVVSRAVLDALGRRTYESYPYQLASGFPDRGTSFTYDALDRVTRRTNPDTSYATFQYLNDGIDVTITDEEGHARTQDWAGFGEPSDARLASVTEPGEGTVKTQYAYNALGGLTEVSPPGTAAKRSWRYNTKNQLDQEIHPESGTVTYTYDPAGNLKTRVDREFGTTTYGYDANERLTSIDRPGTAYDTTLGYDGSDNRTLLQNGYVAATMQYDGANRLDWRTDNIGGVSFTTDYSYDGNDNVSGIAYPSGRSVAYTYDTASRITAVTGGGGTVYADQFQYHPSGAALQFKLGGAAGANSLQQFSYDSRYRLYTSTTGHRSFTHIYDYVGNLKTLNESTRPGRNQTFDYDDLDRLRTATGVWGSATYFHDLKGDRTSDTVAGSSTGYSHDTLTNRLTSTTGVGGTTYFDYDLNGNLNEVNSVGVYTYTPENMLETGGGATYLYDGDNLRKSRTSGTDKSYFIHGPGGQILSEMTSATCRVRDSIYAGSRLIATLRPAAASVTLQATGVQVVEAPTTATVQAVLTTPDGCVLAAPASVSFATSDLTATAGLDYDARTGSVPFAAGTPSGATAAIDISILNDGLKERPESFQVTLTGATGAMLGATVAQTVTILDDDSSLLTLNKVGTGKGTVTSVPAGINCGADCVTDEELFDKGAAVTLTALADPGSTFMGWGGACAGAQATCALTMDMAKTVTARFDLPTLSIDDVTIRRGRSGRRRRWSSR
jgi:YD repeat-containing protein